ncbi:MAG: lactate racemase domain-containing protein, partial [Candidatus Aminicenantes bacterium]|nr:lactate racemase domain-containing protein [Candidatus Aminicenantes bacterium]
MSFPRMLRLSQKFEGPELTDVEQETGSQLAAIELGNTIRPGESVAITAGSRGIANIASIIKAATRHLKDIGAEPFVVPAMGSHGGGTAEGQQEILHSYGVTEEYTGAPIRSSMETVIVDTTPQGIPVHFDRHAYEADHVIVCGRVKPHTGFVGPIESGLHKMMLIGLGKHQGAKIYHRAIKDFSFLEIILAVADVILSKCRVAAGLAIVENAYDETALIEAVAPDRFFEREKELLKLAQLWMPRLPFPEVDLLVVDEIGKNISGSGMDTNVVGRKFNDHGATEDDTVNCKRIFVRGLTRETHGNACGIGMAEVTNQRTVDQANLVATRINALTGGHPSAAAVPIAFETDQEAMLAILETVGLVDPVDSGIIQIANTLKLGEVLVSEKYSPEVRERSDLELVSGPDAMAF